MIRTAWPEPWQECWGKTTYPQCWYERDPHVPRFWYGDELKMDLRIGADEIESAAKAIYRWQRRWWQPRRWGDAGVTTKGHCRLVAWAALAAAKRAALDHAAVAHNAESATTPMGRGEHP